VSTINTKGPVIRLSDLPPLIATSDKLLHLDVLRFVASAGIVYTHSHGFFVAPVSRDAALEQTAGLTLLVDFFFVISGFVITYCYSDRVGGGRQIGRFLQRRVARLVPIHWLTLLISITVWWLVLKAGFHVANMPSFQTRSIAKTVFLLHGIIPGSPHELFFNSPSWSISSEMAMYLALPAFALLAAKWKPAPLIAALLALAGIWMYFFKAGQFSTYDITSIPPVIRALPSFLIGVGLYQQRNVLRRLPAARLILGVSLLVLISSMLAGYPKPLILALVYSTAIAAIASDMQGKNGILVRTLAPLGQLTYSIYMWHRLFILIFMNAIADKLLHGNKLSLMVFTLVCYAGILIWSYVSYQFIETPARRWIDKLSLFSEAPQFAE